MRQIALPERQKFDRADDPGPAPMLQWLDVAELVVDDSYQRELKAENWKAIGRIAASFRWSRFSPVFVAPIEGGRYAVIDGQHRTHAALICGFTKVPCQIVQMSAAEQAASFAAVNGLVTKVTPGQIFKAALASGNALALATQRAVTDAGCELRLANNTTKEKKPGEVYALGLVKAQVKAGNAGIVTAGLAALRRAECGAIADYWSGFVLKVWLGALADRRHATADIGALARFLDDFDVWDCLEQADEQVKKKRRMGFAHITRFDVASLALGEALDKAFPAKAVAA